jgi:toxin ParE1/3/4
MMRLSFSDAAEADLEEIGDLIAEKSPSRAASFVYELREACVGLLKYPKRFPLLRVGGNGGFRQRIVANYRVVYQVRGRCDLHRSHPARRP